jgi:hypothetical protein
MNAKKIFLFGVIAIICLPASVAMGGSRSSHSSFSASRGAMSRPAFTGSHANFASNRAGFAASRGNFASTSRIASNRAAYTPRFQTGLASVTNGRSAVGRRFNQGGAGVSANRAAFASASGRRWSGNGNNWHRRHCDNVVFIGGFYPYSWYYPWYDNYGYYSSAQAVVYDSTASYDDGSLVAQLQSRLAGRGYYRGAVDGVMGPETRRAIRAFERANGLPVDGLIDDQLLSTMGLG